MHDNEIRAAENLVQICEGRSRDYKKRHSFSHNSARIWLRAKFRCEYCDQSLIEHEMAFYAFEYDHILPQSKYENNPHIDVSTTSLFQTRQFTNDELNTFALSCRLCNSLKSNFDANYDTCAYSGNGPINREAREIFVQRARKHIGSIRQEYRDAFVLARAHIERVVKDIS